LQVPYSVYAYIAYIGYTESLVYTANMFQLNFHQRSPQNAILRFNHLGRIVFITIAALFLVVAFTNGNSIIWSAFVIGIISLLSASYSESWKFTKDVASDGSIWLTERIGLWPLLKTRRHDLRGVESVIIITSRPILHKNLSGQAWKAGEEKLGNMFDKRVAKLIIRRSGELAPILITTESSRKLDSINLLADQISGFLQIPRKIV
jgi:hypothetical protein